MRPKSIRREILSVLFIFLIVYGFSEEPVERTTVQELIAREGLPNFFAKIQNGDSIRVGYLGGSITAQPGWRVYSLEWMKDRFPQAEFIEINAAIGGTGSDFGVFRLHDHVLKFKPDLVFIEFAVNDGGAASEKIIRSMEGIVRQIWKNNPFTDVCFIYTLKESFLETEQNGELPGSAATMEKVAEYYGIPTINFGKEVATRVQTGQLIFTSKEQKELNGTMVFSPDGVHPYVETGHTIYRDVLKRSFEEMIPENKARSKKHSGGKPIATDYFSDTQMIDITKGELSSKWEILNAAGQPAFANFGKYLQTIGKASESGESLTVRFKGNTIGVYDIMGPDAGRVIVEIDGEIKDTIYRFDPYCTYRRMNYFLIDKLGAKEHIAVFRLLAEPFDKEAILKKRGIPMKDPADYRENNWYIGKIMLDGILL